MADHYYRLELCPVMDHTNSTSFPYKGILNRSNENAGFDLTMMIDYNIGEQMEKGPFLLGLGTRARLVHINSVSGTETDSHYWLVPRSSLYKRGLMMANSIGVIDSSYRGELKSPVVQIPGGTTDIKNGDRLFQIVAPDMGWIREVHVVSALSETSRGEGGFGSTGR